MLEFINLSSFDWAMRRNWEVPAVFRDGLNPRRSCSYFEEFDIVFVAEPAKPSVVPAATRIKGRSGARIDLSERPRVTSLCCQHTDPGAEPVCHCLCVETDVLFIHISRLDWVFGFRSFSEQVSQQMNIVKCAASDEFELLGGENRGLLLLLCCMCRVCKESVKTRL